MKLTHFDRTVIHGLGLMSRHRFSPDEQNERMIRRIIVEAAARATRSGPMLPLIAEARRIDDNLGPHHSIQHLIGHAMDDFDRDLMAAHWDAVRGT